MPWGLGVRLWRVGVLSRVGCWVSTVERGMGHVYALGDMAWVGLRIRCWEVRTPRVGARFSECTVFQLVYGLSNTCTSFLVRVSLFIMCVCVCSNHIEASRDINAHTHRRTCIHLQIKMYAGEPNYIYIYLCVTYIYVYVYMCTYMYLLYPIYR